MNADKIRYDIPETWGQLVSTLLEAGFDDEYVTLMSKESSDEPLWSPQLSHDRRVHWLGAYPVIGSSEGFYVHVDRMSCAGLNDPDIRECMVLVKFWDYDRAESCANFINRLLCGWTQRTILPEILPKK